MIHGFIILYLTFASSAELAGGSVLARGYHHFVHIGPFFREDAIQASQHVVSGYYQDGRWRYINLTDSLVRRYLNAPWKTQQLSVRDRIREGAGSLAGKSGWRKSPEFRKLYHYAASEYPQLKSSDSVCMLFIVRWYKPELKKHVPDTLVHLKFSPSHE